MSNTGYYNWSEILSKLDDKVLFRAFSDRNSNPEKQKTAEQLLLKRKLIKKNSENKYIKEEVEKKHLSFLAFNLKKESEAETINKLIDRGLNRQTSEKIVSEYIVWKRRKSKLIKPWIFIAPILFISAFVIDNYYIGETALVGLVLLPFTIFFTLNAPTASNFKRKVFLKVLTSEENTEDKQEPVS